MMTDGTISFDSVIAQKMVFIYNALEEGWEIKKKGDSYIFKKRHHNSREVFLDSYLEQFLRRNLVVGVLGCSTESGNT